MKQIAWLLLLFCAFSFLPVTAQRENFSYKFYGFVRGDLYYNTRDNAESVDGVFYLYPLPKKPDANGKDLNANSNSSFYTFTTRLGLDITGPNVGTARSSAKVEADFGGYAPATYLFRVRQAYVNLSWENGSSVLLGQTWHPLFGDVMPEILNLNTGSPFQPFNRSPQFRYQYKTANIKFTGSAIYQLMHLTTGPQGKSEEYLKNSVLPELFAGVDYSKNGFLVGAGVELLSVKPRQEATITSSGGSSTTYKVNERLTTVSYMAQAKYVSGPLTVAAKTLIASNLGHTAMTGGFGVSEIDRITGEQKYTAFRQSTSWANIVYGTKWRGGLFVGYSKSLGTGKELVNTSQLYGSGLDIDQLLSTMVHFSYNLPHWKFGLEYNPTTAWYGTINRENGKVINTEAVTNHRILMLFSYLF